MSKHNALWDLGLILGIGGVVGYAIGKKSTTAPAGQGQVTESAQQWTAENADQLRADIILRELGLTPRQWLALPQILVLPVFADRFASRSSRTDAAYYVRKRFGVTWSVPQIITWINGYAYANLPQAKVIPIR